MFCLTDAVIMNFVVLHSFHFGHSIMQKMQNLSSPIIGNALYMYIDWLNESYVVYIFLLLHLQLPAMEEFFLNGTTIH